MMKLGSETGSVTNHIMSRYKGPDPQIGMGVTICMWSDRHAGTIIDMKPWNGGIELTVQRDKATRIGDNVMSDTQFYNYEPNLAGEESTWRIKPNGTARPKWFEVYRGPTGRMRKCDTRHALVVDLRDEYYDYCF